MSDQGGDPACWLALVCDECGAVVEDRATHTCARPAPVPPAATTPLHAGPDADADGRPAS